jgi:tRNA modification GTPase
MRSLGDTIVAPITALSGAVACVRLSGPEAFLVAARVFEPFPNPPVSHTATYGTFGHGDDGLALVFSEGRGYTGEPAVEFSLHGSPASVGALIDACLRFGARSAEPGEFTWRALMNGRLDLAQAEAVRESVEARTSLQLRQADLARAGKLSAEISSVRDCVARVLATIEATVDFSEEIGELDRPAQIEQLSQARARLEVLSAGARAGALLRNGVRVAIAGLPNAGKSSLFNALLDRDRALVTEIAGTTRDTLEEWISVGGVPCVLIDTAGLRDSEDPIERLGVQRTHEAVAGADLVLYVYDVAIGWTHNDQANVDQVNVPAMIVANKCDLADKPDFGIAVSARTGKNLQAVVDWISAAIGEVPTDRPLLPPRHAVHVARSAEAIASAMSVLSADLPFDLASTELQVALWELGQITGESASEDLLERIFRDFCIGK